MYSEGMAETDVWVTSFEVTADMRARYAAWITEATDSVGADLARAFVPDDETWMHPLDAIATLAAYMGGELHGEELQQYLSAVRTMNGLVRHDLTRWVAYSMGITPAQAKTYDLDRPRHDLRGPSALYRYFDECDRLLYVGITKTPEKRDREHSMLAEWHQFATRQTVEWHEDRDAALAAERAAIRDESPVFNLLGSHVDPDEAEDYLFMRRLIAEAVTR